MAKWKAQLQVDSVRSYYTYNDGAAENEMQPNVRNACNFVEGQQSQGLCHVIQPMLGAFLATLRKLLGPVVLHCREGN